MNKYKVILGGRGSESFIYKVNEEQKKALIDGDVVGDKMDPEDIYKILGVDFYTEAETVYSGPYLYGETDYVVEVYNDKNELIWDSYEAAKSGWKWNYDLTEENDDAYESVAEGDDIFIIEDYCKGNFFEYELEIEDEFNPSLLSPKTSEINERYDLITGLFYNNNLLELYEHGDTWSKGFYYHLD